VASKALLESSSYDQDLRAALAQAIAEAPDLKKAVANESRISQHLQYVRQIAETGKARTPGGQMIELPNEVMEEARVALSRAEEGKSASERDAISSVYESVHGLVIQSVEDDPSARIIEQRALFQSRIRKATKALEALTSDSPAEAHDPEIVETLIELQRTLSNWIESLRNSKSSG
jgi:hypothetical protein